MSHAHSKTRLVFASSLLTAGVLILAGCSSSTPEEGTNGAGGGTENSDVTLTVATSQPETTPNFYCGVELLKERLEEADIGFTVDLFPASQLGPDTERFAAVQAGDIDIDLQGASALSATEGCGITAVVGVCDFFVQETLPIISPKRKVIVNAEFLNIIMAPAIILELKDDL